MLNIVFFPSKYCFFFKYRNVFLLYSHFQHNRISTAHMVLYKDLKESLETFTDERTHISLPLTDIYQAPLTLSRDTFDIFLSEFFPDHVL